MDMTGKKKILIIGAGEAGRMIATEILKNSKIKDQFEIIGFIDDYKVGKIINNIKVLGKIDQIKAMVINYHIDEVIIAIPSGARQLITRILKWLSPTRVTIKIIPGIYEIITGQASWKQIRQVKPEDLLGREEVDFEILKIRPYYQDKTILITGAGGSIGSEIVRNLLKLPIKKLVALGHGENSIHNIIEESRREERFEYVIGDIRDSDKMEWVLDHFKPDLVFHAAAHKHLPLMENYPDEAIKNNIIGTYQTAYYARQAGVEKFILISTDKAVRPTSVMGVSKRIAEKMILSMNQLSARTHYSLVRFGNVLGSRGSVIPAFKKQIEAGGPVLLTHPEIERFFMSIPEAAKLVIKSASLDDGNIFILDMGRPIKIKELAKNLIQLSGYTEEEIPIQIIGLRKGEKLFEELYYGQVKASQFEKILVSIEQNDFFSQTELKQMIMEFKSIKNLTQLDQIENLIGKYAPEFQIN